jgi:hypothetical protein
LSLPPGLEDVADPEPSEQQGLDDRGGPDGRVGDPGAHDEPRAPGSLVGNERQVKLVSR